MAQASAPPLLLGDELEVPTRIRRADPHAEYTKIRHHHSRDEREVWLCEWHGKPLPVDLPRPTMQNSNARARYLNITLVAVKSPALLREATTLRALGVHPSIVRLYDVFLDSVSSAVYLVLEPLEGTARQLMASRKGRPFAQGLLVDMGRQLCEGLAYLHEQGYMHRNLWPESIFASTCGLAKWQPSNAELVSGYHSATDVVVQLKIGELSHACKHEELRGRELLEEDPIIFYRAPELLAHSVGDESATDDISGSAIDSWALGAVLAELTVLRHVFLMRVGITVEDYLASIRDVLEQPLEISTSTFPPGVFPSSTDPLWVACIAKLLSIDPRRRTTARDVLQSPLSKLIDSYPMTMIALAEPR